MINFLVKLMDVYPLKPTAVDTGCPDTLQPIFNSALFVVRIIQIAVPFALVIWGSLDFFKALIAGDEKEMRMKRRPFIGRLVAAIIILALPWLVKLIARQMIGSNETNDFWKCYESAEAKINFEQWHK